MADVNEFTRCCICRNEFEVEGKRIPLMLPRSHTFCKGCITEHRCGSRIWSRGGPQVLRPKVADVAKRSHVSEASNVRPGSRAHLRDLEAFGFLMLKYAFSHILQTLSLSFLTSISTPKVDKNRTLYCTSINLRHSYILHLLFNLHEMNK